MRYLGLGEKRKNFVTVMTQKEAAKYLRISQSYLSRRTSLGEIPHKKIGSKPLYVREIIDKWLTEENSKERG
jgi:excisionase family DNA binding protein